MEEEDVATVVDGGFGDGDGELWLPAELWAMVCQSLSTADLARLSSTCWTLRSHALSRVRHHKAFCPGLVMRRSQIKKILRFLSTLPALVSLDLSEWGDFLGDFTMEYPTQLEKLVVCWTSFGDKGLRKLPIGLKELDISNTMVTGAGLRALGRLPSLRELNMAGICALSVEHLHFIPPSVEVLDVSDCRGPITKQLTLRWPRDRHPVVLPWPPGLRALKLCGYGFFFAHLYKMPATLESLDVSNCYMRPFPVDFDACLPRLQSLHMNHIMQDYVHSTLSLPASLKSVSLKGHPRGHDLLQFAPASLVSLDVEGAHFDWMPDREKPAFIQFIKNLPHRPFLQYQTVPSGFFFLAAADEKANGFRPREEDPRWRAFIKLCHQQLKSLEWVPVPIPPVVVEEELKPDEGEDEEENDDDEDEQGSLLFWN